MLWPRTEVCQVRLQVSAAMKGFPAAERLGRSLGSGALTWYPSRARGTVMNTSSQALSTEFQKRLRAFVRRRVQTDADADDVVQDVLTKLVLHGSRPPGSVHAWLFTVARHVIIDRSRTRRNHVDLDALELAEEPSEGEGAAGELARCLGPMMSAL